jgi:hypothetical protein
MTKFHLKGYLTVGMAIRVAVEKWYPGEEAQEVARGGPRRLFSIEDADGSEIVFVEPTAAESTLHDLLQHLFCGSLPSYVLADDGQIFEISPQHWGSREAESEPQICSLTPSDMPSYSVVTNQGSIQGRPKIKLEELKSLLAGQSSRPVALPTDCPSSNRKKPRHGDRAGQKEFNYDNDLYHLVPQAPIDVARLISSTALVTSGSPPNPPSQNLSVGQICPRSTGLCSVNAPVLHGRSAEMITSQRILGTFESLSNLTSRDIELLERQGVPADAMPDQSIKLAYVQLSGERFLFDQHCPSSRPARAFAMLSFDLLSEPADILVWDPNTKSH